MSNRKAIAVISFGTAYPSAEKSIRTIENDVATKFSDYRVVSAYTSGCIRESLKLKGINVQSPKECLEGLLEDGIEELVVLPTNILAGDEYHRLVEYVSSIQQRFKSVKVCRPMMQEQDIPEIVSTIREVFSVPDNQFLLFMGHGSRCVEANKIYHLLNEDFKRYGLNMFVATVEGTPLLHDAVEYVSAYHPEKLLLTPLMLVSGEHAHNDMQVTWKNNFSQDGYQVECILKGLGDYPEFRQLYINRLVEALKD